ncbi:ABC transporter substrate-binding protein [Microbacterium sp. No. 7]|uniref:ABC transporter substrate-binding protein n=1 Tax=Microbacterium sp. No. 7 TaxID=1714373 RepID=UPI0006D28360|nr:ABC transporter substrate-binding protein [Microbacterium sp. No. 7]
MTTFTRRGLALAAAAASVALLAGCAGGTAETGDDDAPFVFLSDLEPVCFDTGGYKNLANYNVARQILEPLVRQNQDGSYSPALAESWEVSDDGLTWTLHLKEGVTFHDGTTFDAHDVQASADRFFAEGNTLSSPNWLVEGEYEVIDDYTWSTTLESPQANFLQSASTPDFPVLSSESIEEHSDGDRCADPTTIVGAGPFVPDAYVKGESLTLTRFDAYSTGRNEGPAKLKNVEIRFVPEAQARIGALQSGQADAASAVPPLNADALESAGFTLVDGPATGVPFVATLNTSGGPTADVKVRDALFRGADLDAIIGDVYAGRYDRAWTVIAPTTPPAGAYNDDVEGSWTYDQAAAAALLAEAGYTGKNADGILTDAAGEPLVLRWIFDSGDIRDQRDVLAEAIQADVRKIGIDIQIEKLDTSAYLARIEEGSFEIAAESWGQSDAFVVLTVAGPIVNYPKYDDAEVTGWLFEAWATLDDDAHRAELYRSIQQRLSDNRVVLPLYVQNFIVAVDAEYTGIEFDPVGYPTWFTNVERVAG